MMEILTNDLFGGMIGFIFSSNIDIFYKIKELSRNSFKEELKSIINDFKINHKFDIIMSFKFINEFYREKFLFCWDEILRSDNENEKLVKYLIETIGINWVNGAQFKKDGGIISLSSDRNSLSIQRYADDTASLFVDGIKKYDLIVRKEINNINIYLDTYDKNKSMYKTITEVVSDYLEEDGLFILSDVTDKINDNTDLFLSNIMNKEIVEYLNSEDPKLKAIFPLSCNFWHKNCIINCFIKRELVLRIRKNPFIYTYKIFTHKDHAKQVLLNIDQLDCYEIGNQWICNKGVKSYKKDRTVYGDPFSFDNRKEDNIEKVKNGS